MRSEFTLCRDRGGSPLLGPSGRSPRRAGKAAQLPDGDGKAIVQNRCTVCHQLDMLPNQAGATADQWQKVFSTMVALPGDQPTVVSNYLAKSFPVRSKPEPVIVPGSATVSFKEWILPTLGQRPHDPLSTPDGNIWWTGMFANVIGRLDPKTGAMKEYPLKTPGQGLTVSLPTKMAISGSPGTRKPSSASSIRKPER